MQRYPEAAAREVALLQWVESHPVGDLWTADDARWATALARAEAAQRPGTDLQRARARHAAKRLGERDEGLALHLREGLWSWRWPLRAALLGLLLGVGLERLGGPQMNLLALPLWGVLALQLLGYALFVVTSLARWPLLGMQGLWPRWLARTAAGERARAVRLHWLRCSHALQLARGALIWHAALLGLSLGLIAGLYGRALQREYVIGWESTFLQAEQVQVLADRVLAPAAWFTGVPVPPVAGLRHGAAQAPRSPAAPWLHLLAATVLLVALPRVALAASGSLRAWRLGRALPLPGGPRDLRLAVVDTASRGMAAPLHRAGEALSTPEGDRLLLSQHALAPPPASADWVLDASLLPPPEAGWPAVRDTLRTLAPPERWRASWQRLLAAWEAEQLARVDTAAARIADALLAMLAVRVDLAHPDDAPAALQQALQPLLAAADADLRQLHERERSADLPVTVNAPGVVHQPLPRAKSALWGSVVGGALVGLKADIASGGLTLGGGALTGALVGGLGAAGLSDWWNRQRDRRSPRVELDADALPPLAEALLARWLALLPHLVSEAELRAALPPLPTGPAVDTVPPWVRAAAWQLVGAGSPAPEVRPSRPPAAGANAPDAGAPR